MDLKSIKAALSSPISAQIQTPRGTNLASVLIIIYGDMPHVLMTKKPKHLKIHAGEISFPGGKLMITDHDLLDTAIRETKEEINLQTPRDMVIGQLSPVTTLNSGFTITPFVSILDSLPNLKANEEVESILHIPLFPLLETLTEDTNPEHKSIQEMHALRYQDMIIWGASARMLKQIVNKLKF